MIENILMLFAILFILFEIIFTFSFIASCAMDELFPIGEYKKWFQNKNWFGKIYITIAIIFTIPSAIVTYIVFLIMFLVIFIHALGIKEED